MSETTAAASFKPVTKRPSRLRGFLIGLLFILACLSVVVSTIAVWAHRTLLVTDRYVAVAERVFEDPVVIAAVSDRLAGQVVDAVGVEERVSAILPGDQNFIAAALATAFEERLANRLEIFLATERAQAIFVAANRALHERIVALLRSDSDFLSVQGEAVGIDLLGLALEGLRTLQEDGVIPAEVAIPDTTDPATRDAVVDRIGQALGRDLPDDFAFIPIFSAERLAAAQGVVRAFDIVVIGLLIVMVVLIVSTIVLARNRLRMVTALTLGVIVSLILARLILKAIIPNLIDALATSGGAPVVSDVIRDLTADLSRWVWILVLLGVLIGIGAVLLGRPDWATDANAAARSHNRVEAGGGWLNEHAAGVRWSVAFVVGVVLAWLVASPELAVLVGVGIVVVAAWNLRSRTGTPGTPGTPDTA